MQQMNECLQAPTAFMYEHSSEGRKLILDVDGNRVPIERNAYDPSNAKFLYRLLHPRMIAQVGNYYYSLRQRPGKKGNHVEYIPNKKYSYREVKRTLAQIKISASASIENVGRVPSHRHHGQNVTPVHGALSVCNP